jgi:hypothetical protein
MRAAVLLVSLAVPTVALASPEVPYQRHPLPTPAWVVTQLVPSPEMALGGASVLAGMRWQVTPVLYAFGTYRKVSPWRFFVVEPLQRVGGSVELFVSPEYLDRGTRPEDKWLLRVGARANFPLVEHGEALALSVGLAPWWRDGTVGMGLEAGLSTVFGIFGAFYTYSPRLTDAEHVLTLRVRYF